MNLHGTTFLYLQNKICTTGSEQILFRYALQCRDQRHFNRNSRTLACQTWPKVPPITYLKVINKNKGYKGRLP